MAKLKFKLFKKLALFGAIAIVIFISIACLTTAILQLMRVQI